MICVSAGAFALALAAPGFTLEWRHSVTRTLWWERWTAGPKGLAPVEARMTGPGAGMEPPQDAVWRGGAWHFAPHVPPQQVVHLAASGATGGGWRLCGGGNCHDLPETLGPIRLQSAAACDTPVP